MKKVLLIIICFLLLVTGCKKNSNNNLQENDAANSTTNDVKENKIDVTNIKVIINDREYTVNLENNKTVEEFINLLPKEFDMNELNGNEKYIYMDNSLTTDLYKPKHVEKGDVMLYGDDCLVIFYKSFDTVYSYTKIGHINNLGDLENGIIKVKFEK